MRNDLVVPQPPLTSEVYALLPTADPRPPLDFDANTLATSFDREPFEFSHDLASLDLFSLDDMQRLAARYRPDDYFVASGAPTAATTFYSVKHSDCTPEQALRRLTAGNQRILLKRPEQYDRRFADLLTSLFHTLTRRYGQIEGVARLDSSILITSAATITPFHFDPETSFFFQIAGNKNYHIYSPTTLAEHELEKFYVKGVRNIAQVAMNGRDPALEHVFRLVPGKGMHQPRNAPHWVETTDSISISYVISLETEATRALARTRAFNYYQRALGLRPSAVGTNRELDSYKARFMQTALPARRNVGTFVRAFKSKLPATQSTRFQRAH